MVPVLAAFIPSLPVSITTWTEWIGVMGVSQLKLEQPSGARPIGPFIVVENRDVSCGTVITANGP